MGRCVRAAPKLLAAGFGFSSGLGAGPIWVTLGAGVFAGTWPALLPAFFVPCAGFTAITAGALAASPFLVSALLRVGFLRPADFGRRALGRHYGSRRTFGSRSGWICAFTGDRRCCYRGLAGSACSSSALRVAPPLCSGLGRRSCPCLGRRSCPCLGGGLLGSRCRFLRCRLRVPVALLAAAGVGDGVALVWPLAPEFCAVAIVAMAVASARICISFISIPFCALFIQNLHYLAGTAAGAAAAG